MSKPKTNRPDFLWHACGQFLSDFPDKWEGEKIVTHLEENADDYAEEVTPWQPFEDYDGETLAGYIRDLAEKLEAFYNRKI